MMNKSLTDGPIALYLLNETFKRVCAKLAILTRLLPVRCVAALYTIDNLIACDCFLWKFAEPFALLLLANNIRT